MVPHNTFKELTFLTKLETDKVDTPLISNTTHITEFPTLTVQAE